MADGATYRAVFLRMHPTGKAVLSLSEASQGEEATLAGIAAGELGIPPEDVKVVHEDTDRFGEGNSFNRNPAMTSARTSPSPPASSATRPRSWPARCSAPRPTPSPSTTATGRRAAIPRGSGFRRSRSAPLAALRCPTAWRDLWTPRRPTGSGRFRPRVGPGGQGPGVPLFRGMGARRRRERADGGASSRPRSCEPRARPACGLATRDRAPDGTIDGFVGGACAEASVRLYRCVR